MDNTRLLCGRFNEATGISAACYGPDRELIFRTPSWASPFRRDFLARVFAKVPLLADVPVLISFAQFFQLALIPVNGNTLIIGPVSLAAQTGNIFFIYEAIQTVPECVRVEYAQFMAAVVLLAHSLTGRMFSPEEFIALTDEQPQRSAYEEPDSTPASMLPGNSAYLGEGFEQRLLTAIQNGDYANAMQTLSSPHGIHLSIWSHNPVTQEKLLFISFMTMAVRAAIQGGMPSQEAFSISDEYCRRMERSDDVNQVARLLTELVKLLCLGVKNSGKYKSYSACVRSCCDYINGRLYADIDCGELPRLTGYSIRSIRQKFRSETGLTLTGYIHRKRIAEAKHLLRYTSYAIADIGASLGYSSQSHFSKLFRQYTGVTPNQYRENQ
ncbi:MAG TPA: helix-turn-helix domain-containing protein [Candidatus Limiplasma sp.]|nr:helix-turn-helix domain-containing protein [Candidatus Limiplasma sp.]